MKKLISILVIIILSIVMLIGTSYADDGDVIVTLSTSTAMAGDTITLTVAIAEVEDGIAGLEGKITWDTEQLTYVSSQVGSDFSTLNFNDEVESEALGTFTVYGNSYVTSGATVFTVTFQVNEELVVDTGININVTEIKAEYETAGTVDIQDKVVSLSVIEATEETSDEEDENLSTGVTDTTDTTNTTNTTNTVDSTTAQTILPNTGTTLIVMLAIVIVLVVLVISGRNYGKYIKDTKKQIK